MLDPSKIETDSNSIIPFVDNKEFKHQVTQIFESLDRIMNNKIECATSNLHKFNNKNINSTFFLSKKRPLNLMKFKLINLLSKVKK